MTKLSPPQLPKQRLLADLPPPDTHRWVARRKAAVARAVLHGALPRDEAFRRWNLSDEELQSWIARLELSGERALRATRLRDFAN